MTKPRFDRYFRFDELTDFLTDLQRQHDHLMKLESIGRSFQGRHIWLCRVTDFASGDDTHKPAIWVDANIHSAELSGSTLCLLLLQKLVDGYGKDPVLTHCLQTRTFYICPRVNPDGAEWALASVPKLVRSSVRPYPYPLDSPGPGLEQQDIDGDGRVLTMRIPDPNGAWKVCPSQPRLLIPREPTETEGRFYRLLPEGTIQDYDGVHIPLQAKKEQLDLNRNFPAQWREEFEQKGAGAYPTSEPEVRAIVDFIANHANIGAGIALHSYSGALLRPYSYKPDHDMPGEDLWTYEKIGEYGSRMTGYPAVSAYHEFRYHPNEIITGALDDWLYDIRGVFGWTVEIWSPQRQAGIKDYKFIDWYRSHPLEDDIKLLAWSDSILDGKGYVDWYPFEHPQLGPVELGGWDSLFTFWNPPPALLEKEITPIAEWIIWHVRILPRLEWHKIDIQALGADSYRIYAAVNNVGWLPTYVTKNALKRNLSRGVIFEILLAPEATLEHGPRQIEVEQLEGRAYKRSSPCGFGGYVADPTDDRCAASWVVRCASPAEIEIVARHDRAGSLSHRVQIGKR